MIFEIASFAAVLLLLATSLTLLLAQNWRWSIIALALQYIGVFWLVGLSWPLGLAVVKLVTGWMAGAIVGASQPAADLAEERFRSSSGVVFRFIAALMLVALVLIAGPRLSRWVPAEASILTGGLLLIGLGLLHLGMTTRPLRVILGLLTALSGFEILYAVLEQSVMVAGLTSGVTLGLALVGAYLMIASTPPVEDRH